MNFNILNNYSESYLTFPEIIIIINFKAMSVRFNVFFKIAAASMFFGVALGGKFGHQGQLTE